MTFDSNNEIIKLCTQGMDMDMDMDMEGKGNSEEASKLFLQAWNETTTDFEKFTAAHYVARHQKSVANKLKWDETALQLALKIDNNEVKSSFPSLYLNIAKCYEDLNDLGNAKKNYDLALSFTNLLPDNGYGNMVKRGIMKGIERVTNNCPSDNEILGRTKNNNRQHRIGNRRAERLRINGSAKFNFRSSYQR